MYKRRKRGCILSEFDGGFLRAFFPSILEVVKTRFIEMARELLQIKLGNCQKRIDKKFVYKQNY